MCTCKYTVSHIDPSRVKKFESPTDYDNTGRRPRSNNTFKTAISTILVMLAVSTCNFRAGVSTVPDRFAYS